MTSGWIAVVALAGTVVGAAATLTANWLTARIAARTQLTLASGDRERQQAEVRRGACADYLTAVDSFLDQARELVSRMENNAPDPERDDAHAAYAEGWENLQRTCAPVVIAGPRELAGRAESLQSLLGGVGDACDSWYTAHRNGAARSSRASKFSTAQQAAYDARAAFITAAQQHAYASPGQARSLAGTSRAPAPVKQETRPAREGIPGL